MKETASRRKRETPRLVRGLRIGLGGIAGLILLVVILFLFAPVRNAILPVVLSRVAGALPGDITVGRAVWPAPGKIELDGITWVDDTTTLFSADRIGVSVDLTGLVRKDVRVRDAELRGIFLDLPAVESRFPGGGATDERPDETGGGRFPRQGSLPGVPSIGIDRLFVSADSLRLGESGGVSDLTIAGGFDFTNGGRPSVSIDTLAVRGPDGRWGVDSLGLRVDIDNGVILGNGRGRVPPGRPLVFSLRSDGRDRFTLVVAESDSAVIRGNPGVRIEGTLHRDGLAVRSLDFNAELQTPGTAELAADPFLAQHLEGLPELEGVAMTFEGTLWMEPEIRVDLSCDISKNDWIDGGGAVVAYTPELLTLDSLSLNLPGLSLDAAGRASSDSMVVAGDVRVRGTPWLDRFRPGSGVPEDISADIHADITKLNTRDMVRLAINGSGAAREFRIDGLRVGADLMLDLQEPSRVEVTVSTMDRYVGVGAVIGRESGFDARLSPIVINTAPIPRSALAVSPSKGSRIHYVSDTGELSAEGVRITGVEGEVDLTAHRDATGAGAFDLRLAWPGPPALLVGSLGLSDGKADTLHAAWRFDAPFEFNASGQFVTADSLHVVSSGDFKLPGPRTLGALFPDSARIDDLGPIEGRFDARLGSPPPGPEFTVAIDLDSTSWIDSSVVRIQGAAAGVAVDSVGMKIDGVRVGLSGKIDEGTYDFRGLVDVVNAALVGRFVQDAPDMRLHSDIVFRGTPDSPDLNVSIGGSVRREEYEIPEFSGEFALVGGRLSSTVTLPKGATTPYVQLDRLALTAQSSDGGMVPVGLTLTAAGPDGSLYQTVRVDTAGGLTVDVDTLSVGVRGQDLHTTRPFRVQVLSDPQTITIDDMKLEGAIGGVSADGFVNADSSDFTGSVHVVFPEEPPSFLVQEHLWPKRLDLDVHASGTHDVNARARLEGFTLVDETRPALTVELNARSGEVEAGVSIADSSGAVLSGRGHLPAEVVVYPFSAAVRDGPLVFDLELRSLPMVARYIGGTEKLPMNEIVRVDGDVKLRGTTTAPEGVANVKVDFSGWPKLSVYDLAVGAVLRGGGTLDSTLAASVRDFAVLSGDTLEEGLTSAVRLLRSGQRVLAADARYPLSVSINPLFAKVIEGRDLHVQIETDSIPLSDFDPLLPLDISLEGVTRISLAAAGSPSDPSIKGSITTRDLQVAVAKQAHVLGQADLRFDGSRSKPVVRGEIRVDNALIRVPDLPKDLLPMEADALLERDTLSGTERGGGGGPNGKNEQAAGGGELRDADIQVKLVIPSGFWIRGKGLDVELAGNLTIEQKEGRPVIAGELRAVRGTLVILGRSLQLERGTVTFFGGDEINPSLDFILTTRIEGTEIQIFVGGTAQKPSMNFASDPEMSEADIMAVLLFGQPFSSLDEGEANFVRDRSAEMLYSVGAVKLQEELGSQLGIDVLTLKSTGQGSSDLALSVGKYLNPRVLLSYAYSLEDATESFVSIEYFLKGRFKLESTYRTRTGRSSLGVGWSKEYGR